MQSFTHRAKIRHHSAVLWNRYMCIHRITQNGQAIHLLQIRQDERRHLWMVALTGWRGNNYRSCCVVTAVLPLYPLVARVTEGSCLSVLLEGIEPSRSSSITSAIPHHGVTYETHWDAITANKPYFYFKWHINSFYLELAKLQKSLCYLTLMANLS